MNEMPDFEKSPVDLPNNWEIDYLAEVLHAQMLAETPFFQSLKLDGQALKGDVLQSENRFKTIGLAALAGTTQFLDRSRWMFVLVPKAITSTYDHTQNSLLAGVAGGAVFFTWSMIVGESLGSGMRELPKTVDTTCKTFPGFASFFTENLPGLDDASAKNIDQTNGISKIAKIKKFGKSILNHLQRASVGIGLGCTPYVASAVAKGFSKKETTKADLLVTSDTSGLIAGLGAGIVYGLDRLVASGNADTARWISDWIVENNYFWLTGAALSIGATYISNKRKRKKAENQNEVISGLIKEKNVV